MVSNKTCEKLFLLFILFLALFFSNSVVREGFSSKYIDCINSGFSKEFCVQTPTSVIGPDASSLKKLNVNNLLN